MTCCHFLLYVEKDHSEQSDAIHESYLILKDPVLLLLN